jgi:AraC-like DNA-binding protein
MNLVAYTPCSALHDYVETYYHVREVAFNGIWYRPLIPPVMQCLTFSFSGRNVDVITKREGQIKLPSLYFVGNLTRHATAIINGPLDILIVHFKPSAIYKLFHIPIYELVERGVSLYEVMGTEALILEEQILAASSNINDCIAIIEKMLLRRIAQSKDNHRINMIDHAVKLLFDRHGNVTLKDITAHSYTTKKTLERSFIEIIGLYPKTYSSIIRFNAALRYMQHPVPGKMKDLIYTLGYTDHAHFCRDFKKYAGQSPKEYLHNAADFEAFFYGE